MRIREHEYYFPTLVVGNELNALVYAYLYNLPLLKTNITYPFPFEFFDKDFDLSIFNFPHWENVLKNISNDNVETIIGVYGWQKKYIYERLNFVLSLSGQNFMSDKFSLASLGDGNSLSIYTKEEKTIKVKYDKLILFDDQKINNLPSPTKEGGKKKIVVDWINARCIYPHAISLLETKFDFINKIYFYRSVRLIQPYLGEVPLKSLEIKLRRKEGQGKLNEVRDLIVCSYLTPKQLLQLEYSETYSVLITKQILQKKGMTGTKKLSSFRAMKLDHDRREIKDIDRSEYENTSSLEFKLNLKEEDIIKKFLDEEKELKSYAKKINFGLFYPREFSKKKLKYHPILEPLWKKKVVL